MSITELKNRLGKATAESERIKLLGEIKALSEKADASIRNSSKELSYAVREWSIEMIVQKYSDGLETDENELFIPDYQRDYKWPQKTLTRFIESILIDFPIPYLYIADVDEPDNPELDGRIEIIDGSQRIRALYYFVNNHICLSDLKEIKELEGFYFKDLSAARRRRFLRETIRLVELKGAVDESVRRDLFERINSGVEALEAMEVRHGGQDADTRFYRDVVTVCSEAPLFAELAPLSEKKRANMDHRELVLRFFAYLNNRDNYKGFVKPFLDEYLHEEGENNTDEVIQQHLTDFNNTMKFIKEHIPIGFRKTLTSKTTPRARYEALAVGTALALKEEPELTPATPISDWLTSDEFQQIVGADSANNASQLNKRIEYVRDKLLEG